MAVYIKAEGLKKTFRLSEKQRRLTGGGEKFITAVNNVSFECRGGEIFGLLGPNGAGKTTALRILATLIKPDEGDAEICGCSVTKTPELVRGKIGFLTSELKLEDFFTPSYLFDFFSSLHGVDKETAAARKAEMFISFGIDRFAQVKVANLSTGMKQKASLVISMCHDPDVVIFDEPTNGLDVLTAKTVTDYLISLKNAGKCVVISTHIMSLAEKLCDRAGIIINGKMICCGTLEKVCAGQSLEDRFFDIYRQEVGGIEE